jgi:hypothetical protein
MFFIPRGGVELFLTHVTHANLYLIYIAKQSEREPLVSFVYSNRSSFYETLWRRVVVVVALPPGDCNFFLFLLFERERERERERENVQNAFFVVDQK